MSIVPVLIAVSIAAASFAAGFQVRAWKAGADDRDRAQLEARDAHRRSDQAITAAAGYEAAKAALRPRTITITREIERAVQADPDCSSKPLPASLRDALTSAARGSDQPLATGSMPAASAAGAFDLGRLGARLRGNAGGAAGLRSPAEGPSRSGHLD